jgi:hypothetical protein
MPSKDLALRAAPLASGAPIRADLIGVRLRYLAYVRQRIFVACHDK